MDEVVEKVRRDSVLIEYPSKTKKDEGLRGDYGNIFLLVFLYILQGIPLGIMVTIPMILASNNVGYDKQAIFTFARYPYVLKLLWAPIVDSVYSKRFGRRKSWLIPSQYCIGGAMILISTFADQLVGDKTHPPQIYLLTLSMFFIVFLTATQDVAVDAWALTLLQKRNVYYASSCNAVGCICGAFISNTLFLALDSPEFCNKFLRTVPQATGIVNIQAFLFSCGILFTVATTMICIFKTERTVVDEEENDDDEIVVKGVCNTYKMLFKILRLKSVLWFASIQLTVFIGGATIVNVTDLKLIQFGVRRENLSMLKAPISILNLFLPFFIVHKTKHNPLLIFWKFGFYRLFVGIAIVGLVAWTQTFNSPNSGFPYYYYAILLFTFMVYDVVSYSGGMAMWAFMAKIADPSVGATYMTLLTTLCNVGMKWTGTLSLWLIEPFTIKWYPSNNCFENCMNSSESLHSTNDTSIQRTFMKHGKYFIDGYYVETAMCTVFGFIWLFCYKPVLGRMQEWPESEWRVVKHANKVKPTKF